MSQQKQPTNLDQTKKHVQSIDLTKMIDAEPQTEATEPEEPPKKTNIYQKKEGNKR